MPNELKLPDGITQEAFDRYAMAHHNAIRRACYANHPERVMRQRLTSAVNLLHRHGLIDTQQRQTIAEMIRTVIANG